MYRPVVLLGEVDELSFIARTIRKWWSDDSRHIKHFPGHIPHTQDADEMTDTKCAIAMGNLCEIHTISRGRHPSYIKKRQINLNANRIC